MQKKTAVLAATTPQDDTTFHAFMINAIDDNTGKPIFNVVNLVEVCAECLKTDKPWKCPHTMDRISGSKSKADRDITLKLIRDEGVRMREMFGQQTKADNKWLKDEWMQRFHNSKVPIDHPVRAVYMGIDPGGGGDSEMALTAIAETYSKEFGTRLAVVALAAVSLRDTKAADLELEAIQQVILKLREDGRFTNAPVIIAAEANMGIQTSYIDKDLSRLGLRNVCIMRERIGYMSGVPINEQLDNELLFELKDKMRSGYLVYADRVVTYSTKKFKTPEKELFKMKEKHLTQMGQIRILPRKKTQQYGPQKFFVTGKSAPGAIDDMADATKMACYWRGVFLRDTEGKYSEWHAAIPNFENYYYPL